MKTNKNILLLFILCTTAQVTAGHHRNEPIISPATAVCAGVGVLTATAGQVTKLYGLYTFFSNINFFCSGKQFSDYSKQELGELSQEELAILVKRENERIKNKEKGVFLFLTGLGLDIIGGSMIAGAMFASVDNCSRQN